MPRLNLRSCHACWQISKYGLSNEEVMQLINLAPRNLTDFYLIVYEMDERDVRGEHYCRCNSTPDPTSCFPYHRHK